MENGGLKKSNYVIAKVFTLFKNYFLRSNIFENNFKNINYTLNIFDKKIIFYKFDDLINHLGKFISCAYAITAVPVPKKLKRKLKKKFIHELKYIKTSTREKIAMKWLKYSTVYYNNNKLLVRLFKSVINTCIEGRESKLFKKKLYIYRKIFGKILP